MIRSVLTNFSARLGGAVLSFLMLLLTTRYLGKDVRGEIAAIQLAISIVQLVSDLAGSSSMVYLVPRTSLTKLLLAGSAWAVFSAATIGLSLVHFFDVIPANYNYATLLIALLISLHSINQSILLGQQRLKAVNLFIIAQGVMQYGGMLLCIFVFNLQDAWPFVYACLFSYSIMYLIGLLIVTRHAPKPSLHLGQGVLSLLFLNGFFTQGANLGMKLVLSRNYSLLKTMPGGGNGAVGIFSTAYALGEAILLFAASASTIIIARVANKGDHEAERSTVLRLSKLSLGMTILAVVFFALLPPEFYSMLIGGKKHADEFLQIKSVFLSLTPGTLVLSFATVYSHYFSGAGKHYLNFISSIIAYACVMIFSGMLVDTQGINGAGWSTSISYCSLSLFVFIIFMLIGGNKKDDWKALLPSGNDVRFIKQYLRGTKAS